MSKILFKRLNAIEEKHVTGGTTSPDTTASPAFLDYCGSSPNNGSCLAANGGMCGNNKTANPLNCLKDVRRNDS
ncbi:MAG: hypothetical protein GY765_29770 [bacterium]|nr:hypothetical protein [bacterium]